MVIRVKTNYHFLKENDKKLKIKKQATFLKYLKNRTSVHTNHANLYALFN